jgi:hypothetical protein
MVVWFLGRAFRYPFPPESNTGKINKKVDQRIAKE